MNSTFHGWRNGLCGLVCAIFVALLFVPALPVGALTITHVIHISVDGLRPDAITVLGPTNLPHFYRLRTEGAFTDNARCDYDYSITLPNHTCQLTGRGVLGTTGHNWTNNTDPPAGATLAANKGSYVAGVFDVVHDHGLSTGEFASKSKFSLFATSWNATNGAPDVLGPDNGRNKIDVYVNDGDTARLVGALLTTLSNQPLNYAFLHLADPDTVGHSSGWNITPGSPYSNTIKTMDTLLGAIFDFIESNSNFSGSTMIILTSDHGGSGNNHSNAALRDDYTVPFYIWGPGVMAGADLYVLNPTNRANPGTNRPAYSANPQPVRNGDAANAALKLLGLEPVPGSTINTNQDLALTVLPAALFRLSFASENPALEFLTISNVLYDLQTTTNLNSTSWHTLATNSLGTGGLLTNVDALSPVPTRFYRLLLHF